MSEKVLIEQHILRQLIEDSKSFEALQVAGVDNWDWYEDVAWPSDEEVDAELVKLSTPTEKAE